MHFSSVWIVQDFSQQPPAQELIARDLHDVEWKFRHIFRGKSLCYFVILSHEFLYVEEDHSSSSCSFDCNGLLFYTSTIFICGFSLFLYNNKASIVA